VTDDELRELERQVERGNLFAHSVLTEHATRVNQNEAVVSGLVELLISQKMVDADELIQFVNSVRTEIADAGHSAKVEVMVRTDGEGPHDPGEPVDCAARLHVCKAVCCRLHFPLTVAEIESGPIKWDLGRPYLNRHGPEGYCHQIDTDSFACHIYDERPVPCRAYSCVHDERIWKDFEAMELNQEWIDEHVGAGDRGPVEIFMNAYAESEGS
jgi:Fe-S-cluster containining protein